VSSIASFSARISLATALDTLRFSTILLFDLVGMNKKRREKIKGSIIRMLIMIRVKLEGKPMISNLFQLFNAGTNV